MHINVNNKSFLRALFLLGTIQLYVLVFASTHICFGGEEKNMFLQKQEPEKLAKIKKNTNELKENIGLQLKELLTLSSDLIASLAQGQTVFVSKMHDLVAQEGFFANAKQKKLDTYLKNLESMGFELENKSKELSLLQQKIDQEFVKFACDFS